MGQAQHLADLILLECGAGKWMSMDACFSELREATNHVDSRLVRSEIEAQSVPLADLLPPPGTPTVESLRHLLSDIETLRSNASVAELRRTPARQRCVIV